MEKASIKVLLRSQQRRAGPSPPTTLGNLPTVDAVAKEGGDDFVETLNLP